ncbi:unnamed protein product, partial [Rotaria sp. Silwood1]
EVDDDSLGTKPWFSSRCFPEALKLAITLPINMKNNNRMARI